jgi:hypothetical protein
MVSRFSKKVTKPIAKTAPWVNPLQTGLKKVDAVAQKGMIGMIGGYVKGSNALANKVRKTFKMK